MKNWKIDWTKLKLDPYEREIEDNIEKASPVEDEAYWKRLITEAAKNTLKKSKVTIEFSSESVKEKAIRILERELGRESFK